MEYKNRTLEDFEEFRLNGMHHIFGGRGGDGPGPGDKEDEEEEEETSILEAIWLIIFK